MPEGSFVGCQSRTSRALVFKLDAADACVFKLIDPSSGAAAEGYVGGCILTRRSDLVCVCRVPPVPAGLSRQPSVEPTATDVLTSGDRVMTEQAMEGIVTEYMSESDRFMVSHKKSTYTD